MPVPKVNGGINVHPLRRLDFDAAEQDPVIVPELVALQVRTVYELGFDGLRITVPFGDRGSFLAAIPYARAARALGIDSLVVLADFAGLVLAQRPPRRRAPGGGAPALRHRLRSAAGAGPAGDRRLGPKGVGRVAFEILNEPTHFLGLPPDVYVHEILAPCFTWLKAANPEVIVVSAAEVGNIDGPARIRAMLEAGLESVTDRVNYHVYSRSVIPLLSANVAADRLDHRVRHRGHRGPPAVGARHVPRDPGVDRGRDAHLLLRPLRPGPGRLPPPGHPARRRRLSAVVESGDLHGFLADNVAAEAAGRCSSASTPWSPTSAPTSRPRPTSAPTTRSSAMDPAAVAFLMALLTGSAPGPGVPPMGPVPPTAPVTDGVDYPLGRPALPDFAAPGEPFKLVDLRYDVSDTDRTTHAFAAR